MGDKGREPGGGGGRGTGGGRETGGRREFKEGGMRERDSKHYLLPFSNALECFEKKKNPK